jgi:signal peptidase I
MSRFSIVRFGVVKVEGPSMEPALTAGDWLFVRWFSQGSGSSSVQKPGGYRAKIGKIVVIEREVQPGIFYIKRVKKVQSPADEGDMNSRSKQPRANQYWVEGDNPAGTDSRTWGWISESEIRAKVIGRYRKAR